jgi:hypothetical protein
VADGTDIYLIDGTEIVETLSSGGGGEVEFSGGLCTTCGVAVDPVSGNAVISVSTLDGFGGYQVFNLASHVLGNVIEDGNGIAEHFALTPSSGGLLILSPPEDYFIGESDPDFNIVDIAPPSFTNPASDTVYDFADNSALFGTALDAVAIDSTGIVYAPDEFTGNLFLADLSNAAFNNSSTPPTWNAPNQIQVLTELSLEDMCGLQVAFGVHEALVEEEFDDNAFGAIQLPSSSSAGTAPSAPDWVMAVMPNDPSGNPWFNPLDPHGLVAAFTSYALSSGNITVGNAHGMGFLINAARTYVAVIDLDALLAAPRLATSGPGSHTSTPGSTWSRIMS